MRSPLVASRWMDHSEWPVLDAVSAVKRSAGEPSPTLRTLVCWFSSFLASECNASPAGLSSALRLGSVIGIFMLMLGPVLMRMLVPVVACESADGGSARPSDESAR
jgi:hypothetical protein